jgi:hypothetical protein
MTDYFAPTVIQPSIPIGDMTELERLLLSEIFDSEKDGDALYFYSETGPSDFVSFDRATLEAAITASADHDSQILQRAKDALAQHAPDAQTIDIDLPAACVPYEIILQDIVRRSSGLQYISIVSSFTCSKMRPDGFGGSAVVITANSIRGKSTNDIIDDFLNEEKCDL